MVYVGILAWRAVNSFKAGIRNSMIAKPTWIVLNILKRKGFEAYLVGGCVRDLLLKKTPKDFDVVTTAELKEIKKEFSKCLIVGKRFPICHVHIGGSVIEVSSFETTDTHAHVEKKTFSSSQIPTDCDEKDLIRWRNCMKRDFTINSLFYDPFVNKIYDYAGGLKDIQECKVQTLIPAHLSFTEDCARILRGLRIAARLGLVISEETATAIRDHSASIAMLDKQRLMMEMNYMLAFGAAQSSFRLLSKFKLLEILLPLHAAYLAQAKKFSTGCLNMLMHLLASMDKLLAADRPCDSSLWIGLLALHLALINHPQDAFQVLLFASVLYHGDWKKAVEFATQNAPQMHVHFLPEISGTLVTKSYGKLLKEVSQFASLAKSSLNALTDKATLRKAMDRYPTSPCLGLVFISKMKGTNTSKLFDVLEGDIKSYVTIRKNSEIDYKLLAKGNLNEVRFVLGKIVLDTMIDQVVQEKNQQAANGKQNQGEQHGVVREQNVVVEDKEKCLSKKKDKEKCQPQVSIDKSERERKKNGGGDGVQGQNQQAAKGRLKHGVIVKQNAEVEHKEKCQPQVSIDKLKREREKNGGGGGGGGGVLQEQNHRRNHQSRLSTKDVEENQDEKHPKDGDDRLSKKSKKQKDVGILQVLEKAEKHQSPKELNSEVAHKEKCRQPQLSRLFR